MLRMNKQVVVLIKDRHKGCYGNLTKFIIKHL